MGYCLKLNKPSFGKGIVKPWESSQIITLKAGVQFHLLRVDVPIAFHLERKCKVPWTRKSKDFPFSLPGSEPRICLCAPSGINDLFKKACGWVWTCGFLAGPLLADISSHHWWRTAVPSSAAVMRVNAGDLPEARIEWQDKRLENKPHKQLRERNTWRWS